MPLTKRAISPVDVSRHRLPATIRDGELQCLSNGTLANLIRQMSSLSRHAENIFGELFHEAMRIEHRTQNLLVRLDRLGNNIEHLDVEDDTKLHDTLLRKPYKSSTLIDQQSLSRQTMPAAMQECYARCDVPPDLDALNIFRTDGREGLKFYTDPNYFFELWRDRMLAETNQQRQMRHHHAHPQRATQAASVPQQRHKQRRAQRNNYIQNQLINLPDEYQAPEHLRQVQKQAPVHVPQGMVRPRESNHYSQQTNGHAGTYAAAPVRANFDSSEYGAVGNIPQQMHAHHAFEAHNGGSPSKSSRGATPSRPTQPPPPLPAANDMANDMSQNMAGMSMRDSVSPDLPPPPPPLMMTQSMMANDANLVYAHQDEGHPPPPPETVQVPAAPVQAGPAGGNIPPPPPPPPPGFLSGGSGFTKDSSVNKTQAAGSGSNAVPAKATPPRPSVPGDLLAAIRQGKQLRKVDKEAEEKREKEDAAHGHNVAAILQRRLRATRGESSTEDESASDGDEDEWSD